MDGVYRLERYFTRVTAIVLGLAAVFMVPAVAPATEVYVAPGAKPGGDGSIEKPYDIFTVFSGNARVKPGDTVLLLGGQYDGLEVTLHSHAGRPDRGEDRQGALPTFVVDHVAVDEEHVVHVREGGRIEELRRAGFVVHRLPSAHWVSGGNFDRVHGDRLNLSSEEANCERGEYNRLHAGERHDGSELPGPRPTEFRGSVRGAVICDEHLPATRHAGSWRRTASCGMRWLTP